MATVRFPYVLSADCCCTAKAIVAECGRRGQKRSQRSVLLIDFCIHHLTASHRVVLVLISATLFAVLSVFSTTTTRAAEEVRSSETSVAEPTLSDDVRKHQREIEKLDLEVKKLDDEIRWRHFPRLASAIGPIAVVLIGGLIGYIFNKRLSALQDAENRRQSNEEAREARLAALIEDRTKAYAVAYENLRPTALFFPESASRNAGAAETSQIGTMPVAMSSGDSLQLTKADCAQIGRQLASWYFGPGGLLMTKDSRNAYFTLMEALRRAVVSSDDLASQTVSEHPRLISEQLVQHYRELLAEKYPTFGELQRRRPHERVDLANWHFGPPAQPTSDADRFKDFVLIQTLASRFRTTLTDDIGSRKPPDGSDPDRLERRI